MGLGSRKVEEYALGSMCCSKSIVIKSFYIAASPVMLELSSVNSQIDY